MNGQDARQLLMKQIAKEQFGRISAEFARQAGTTVKIVPTADGAKFMYAADHFLVRADKVPDVQRFLGEASISTQAPEEVIPGVKLVRFTAPSPGERPPSVLDVIEQIDAQVGADAASTDHVLTVTPEAGPCPATEPEEVYFQIEPSPGVRMVDDRSDGTGAKIYVADTGLLADADTYWWLKGVQGRPDPLDPKPGELIQPYAGHGTFVAGVARCMAPGAEIFVSNVFKVAGSALESDFVKDLAAALEQGYDIFNLSVTTQSRKDLQLLGFDAFRELLAQHPDVVCVVAAGNDGEQSKFWPAAYPEMVSVGALAADWRSRASFSNHGDWVKVYGPGRDLVNAYPTGIYECKDTPYEGQIRRFYGMAKWSGTSFSTPLVAGLIAARKSRTGQTARHAADSLLADAKSQAIPHIGAILLPYDNAFRI